VNGPPRGVLKLSFALRRLPHLSREEFQRYWRETHAPLVAKHREVLRIERYVQLHALGPEAHTALRESRGAPEEFDGVAELWWRSLEDLAAAVATEDGRRASVELLEDERRFIDLARSVLTIGREHAVLAPRPGLDDGPDAGA
jgi:uncharacterized protein (TIGR02118 family)